jgi:hypothetical protein
LISAGLLAVAALFVIASVVRHMKERRRDGSGDDRGVALHGNA